MASIVLQVLLLCLTCGLASGNHCYYPESRNIRHCFTFVNDELTWIDAELHCVTLGGNLASFHNQEEHDIVKERANEKHVWIGGHDAIKGGKWLWSDGSAFDYTNWTPEAPDNRKKGEHCMEMNNSGAMNVKSCDLKKHFVCVKKHF